MADLFRLLGRQARNLALRGLGVQLRDLEISEQLTRSGILLYEIDLATQRYTHLSGPVTEITGWSSKEWAARQYELLHPEDRDDFWIDGTKVQDSMLVDRTGRFQHADGTYLWLRDLSRIQVGPHRRQLRGLSVDVSASQAELLRMRRRATIDALTGVGNRFALVEELAGRLDDSRDGIHDFALIMIDFNRLKELNDQFGHAFGDEALRQFAARVNATLRPGDTVARLGGDEFAVIASGVSEVDEVKRVAERIAGCTDEPFVFEDVVINASVSIGAVLTDPDCTADQLLAFADQCMYASKRGRRPFVIGTPDRSSSKHGGISLKAELDDAVQAGEVGLWFQPKVDLASGRVVGFEGLSRWMHPTLGLIAPAEFIHLLGERDVWREHNDRILEQGFVFLAAAGAAGFDVHLAVNISAVALFDRTLPERITAALAEHGVAPELVTLEVTESDIMKDITDPRAVLEDLAELGLRVSIDDFGTGYSSLARLRDLPVTEIKIDRRFVSTMLDEHGDRVIVQTVCDLARNLGLTVVAEGDRKRCPGRCVAGVGVCRRPGLPVRRSTVGIRGAGAPGASRRQAADGTRADDRALRFA